MVTKAAWPCCHTWNLSWPTSWRDSLWQSVEYLSLYFQHWLWRLLVWLSSISNLWGHLKCLGLGKLIQPYLKTLKCTSQSKASTSPPKQQPGYKFHIHVGQFKVIKCPTLGKLQSLCDLSQSTTCEATTFPFEIIQSPFVLLQAPRHTGIMWLGRGRGRAYGVDAFLSSPEQAFFTIGFAQTNE